MSGFGNSIDCAPTNATVPSGNGSKFSPLAYSSANSTSNLVSRDSSGNVVLNSLNLVSLTASQPVFTDSSKNLVSVATIANSFLTNSSVTVTAGTGLSGGGTVSLGGTITLTNTNPASSGSTLGISRASSTTAISTTTVLLATGTTPTSGNTDLLISNSYTATSSTSHLTFTFSAPFSRTGTDGGIGLFLFDGTTLLKSFICNIGGTGAAAQGQMANFTYDMVSGSTSSKTYNLRFAATKTGTVFLLQDNTGTAFYNSASGTSIQFNVTETVA